MEVSVRSPVHLGRGAAAVTSIAAALIAAAAAPALAAGLGRESAGARSAPTSTVNDILYGVAAASRSSAWAVGTYQPGTVQRTLIERWNGRSWTTEASPSPGGTHGSFLNGVADVSSSSAWAVGGYSNGAEQKTLIEHWNGRSWKQVPSPSPGGVHDSYLFGVTAISSSSAWAVGGYSNGTAEQTLIEHWNGRSWKRVASPNPAGTAKVNDLERVSATSPSNAWAVGYYGVSGANATRTLVEHWNGRSWTRVASPNPGGSGRFNGLYGVAADSSTSAWAAGVYFNGVTDQPMVEHWSGRSWKRVAIPNPGGAGSFSGLGGAAAVSPSSAWVVGIDPNGTLIEHWNGRSWKQVASPSPGGSAGNYLYDVTAVSTSNAWAVGKYHNGPSSLTLIEHWNGKAWRHVASPSR